MKYQAILDMEIDSDFDAERVERQITALFKWGTATESFVDGLHLLETPTLITVKVAAKQDPLGLASTQTSRKP